MHTRMNARARARTHTHTPALERTRPRSRLLVYDSDIRWQRWPMLALSPPATQMPVRMPARVLRAGQDRARAPDRGVGVFWAD